MEGSTANSCVERNMAVFLVLDGHGFTQEKARNCELQTLQMAWETS